MRLHFSVPVNVWLSRRKRKLSECTLTPIYESWSLELCVQIHNTDEWFFVYITHFIDEKEQIRAEK